MKTVLFSVLLAALIFLGARLFFAPDGVAAEALPALESSAGPRPKPSVVADATPALIAPEPVDVTAGEVESDQEQGPQPSAGSETSSQDAEDDEAHFKWLRETSDVDQLTTEIRELEMQIVEMCQKDFMKRLDEGEYEQMAERSIMLDDKRAHFIETYTDDADGNLVRITLPEAQYPEPYKLKRKQLWLTDLLKERR